jgi:hypothetical protein
MGKIRTFWDITVTLGVPFSRWGAIPYIVHPLPFPSGILSSVVSESCDEEGEEQTRVHPYHQACRWRQEMEWDSRITKAKIAAREGLSRARVTQLMNLLDLPTEVQEDLQNPPAALGISCFSERRLRQIVACGNRELQLRRWQELVQECQILVRK